MWPFDYLRQRTYSRRYKAALVVLLGAHISLRMEPAQRSRVEQEITENFQRSLEPAVAWRRWARWDVIAAFYAAAMDRLGIPPGIADLAWSELFAPWRHWRGWPQWPLKDFDNRAAFVTMDFRPMHQATVDAKAFLRACGLNVPDEDPWELGAVTSIDGIDPCFATKRTPSR